MTEGKRKLSLSHMIYSRVISLPHDDLHSDVPVRASPAAFPCLQFVCVILQKYSWRANAWCHCWHGLWCDWYMWKHQFIQPHLGICYYVLPHGTNRWRWLGKSYCCEYHRERNGGSRIWNADLPYDFWKLIVVDRQEEYYTVLRNGACGANDCLMMLRIFYLANNWANVSIRGPKIRLYTSVCAIPIARL